MLTQAAHTFEGIATFGQMDAQPILIRIGLMLAGFLLIDPHAKNILDPIVLMPMGLAMVLVNGAAPLTSTIILPFAMGPNVAGVITTAIIAGIYVGLLR